MKKPNFAHPIMGQWYDLTSEITKQVLSHVEEVEKVDHHPLRFAVGMAMSQGELMAGREIDPAAFGALSNDLRLLVDMLVAKFDEYAERAHESV